MRRISISPAWKQWRILVVLAMMLPGLLQLSAMPAWAQPADAGRSLPETPRQQFGSAGRLPALVSSEVTKAVEDKSTKRDPKRPKGALPLQDRAAARVDPDVKGLKSAPPVPGHEVDMEAVPTQAIAPGQEPWPDSEDPSVDGTAEVRASGVAAGPIVSSVFAAPATMSSGTWVTPTMQPMLAATVTDPQGRTVGINVQVQHDPAVPSQGTGLIWSTGTGASTTSGGRVSVTVPSGKLQDGWRIQFRIQGWAASSDSESGAWSAWQSLRVDRAKPSVSSVSVAPATLSSGTWVTSVLEPRLSARVTDPEGRAVGLDVEVQHDPAVPSQGSGLIWSRSTAKTTTSGGVVAVTVSSGELRDGWLVQWRVRGLAASSDSVSGAWSAWQSLRVDRAKPSVSSLSVAPGKVLPDRWVTSELEPRLSAIVTDPENRAVGVSLEVRHSPTVPEQGSGEIWSVSTGAYTDSGKRVSIDVPTGKLRNGWLVEWRIQGWAASTDSVSGPWSAWQSMKIDVLTWEWASPLDNSQVGSLTPTLAAYVRSGDPLESVQYYFQVCAGTPGSWTWCEDDPSAWSLSNGWQVPAGKLKWGETYWWQVQSTVGSLTETSPWRSFTTIPEQGTINALLASGTDGREFNHTTGNYTQSVTDASVASVGLPLSVVRTYNSLDPRADGAFGAGWSTRWDMRIQDEPQTKTVLVTYPDGREYRFATRGDGTYAPPQANFAKLATVEGGGWRLMDKSSTSYWFDAEGRLTKLTDRRDRSQELTYGADGKLSKITAVAGSRSLTLGWTGDHVTSVSTGPVDGEPLTWTYGYTGDTLTKVCPPGAQTACTTYSYTSASRYSSVVLNAKPAGYWRLGGAQTELGGKITSAAAWNVGSDNATLTGSIADTVFGVQGALAGSPNTAMSFKGTANSARVQLPPAAISGRSGMVSVEAWFRTTGSGTIIGYNNATGGAHTPALYVGTDGKLRGQFYTGKAEPITSGAAVNDGNWHHAVLSGADNTQTLYLDGQAVGTLSGTITHMDQSQAQIGYGYASSPWPSTRSDSGPFPFTGDVDEVAVYGKPLGAAEIRTHYAARTAQPQLATTTMPSGRVWASATYEADGGRLLTHTDSDGGAWRLSSPEYVKNGARESGVDAKTTITDPQQGTLSYLDDVGRGNLLMASTDQLGHITKYVYDEAGLPAKVTDPNGNVTELSHDVRGNTIARKTCRSSGNCQQQYYSYFYNEDDPFDPRNNQLITARDARSSSATDNTYAATAEYNSFGEQVKQTTPATPDFLSGRSSTITYTDGTESAVGGGTTPAGLVESETDYRGKTTTHAYTASGDHAEVRLPAGLVTKYGYDVVGRVVSKTEVSEANPDGVTTTYTYDGVGRVVTYKGPGIKNEVTGVTHTSEVKHTYDPDGNTLAETASDLTGGDPARTVTYTYDDFGRVETVTGPEGGKVTHTWNPLGDQSSTVDELGNRFEFGYTARGELATRTLKGWTGSPVSPQPAKDVLLASFSYDPGGRLAAESDAMGRKISYTYHGDNRLQKVTADDVKLNGVTTTRDVVLEENTYDPAGNVVKVVGGGGIERIDYVVDAAGRLTSETFDPAGLARRSAYVYDANGNLAKATKTKGGVGRAESVEFTYNDDDVLTRRTVENGDQNLITTWKVDERGLVVEETNPRGNASGANAADFTAIHRYDVLGRLIEVKAPEIKAEQYGAEPTNERPVTRFGYDSGGRRTHEVDEAGAVTTSAFDRLGRLVSVTGFAYEQPGGETLTPTEAFAYNPAGQVTKYTDERGSIWTTEYDALGNRVKVTEPAVTGKPAGQWVYEYDLAGELLAAVDPTGARVESTYDDLGRAISTTVIERKPTTEAHITRLEYNDAGTRTKEIGPLNRTTSWEVNAAGQVTKETDPAGNATSFDYDLAGRSAKVTNALGNSTISEYDLAGRRIAVKETDNTGTELRATNYGYDADGNETSETTPEGHTISSTYDATGLLTELVEPVAEDKSIRTTYGYDITGALTRATDGRGNTFWTSFNSLGLAEKTIEPATAAHPNEADRTWTYVYDAGGNMVSALQPGGVRIDHTYDSLGRVVKQTGSGAEAATPEWTFGYDAAGRSTTLGDYTLDYNDRGLLTKIAKGGTQTVAFTYDAYGNPIQKQDVNGTTGYGWDAVDRLKTFTDAVSGRSLTYDYDPADRPKTLTSANPGGKQEFGYDDLDRITSHTLLSTAGSQLSKITYGWDKNDNLMSKVTAGTAGAGSNAYTYDRSDRMTSWTGPDGTKTTYEWDDSGNRVKVGGTGFVFDERNRLLSGGGAQYTYSPRGTLATETVGGVTKQLKFDAFDNLVSDGDATYTYDNLGRLSSRTHGGVEERFVYAGLQNDMVAVTDSVGTVKARFGRDPDGHLVGLEEGGVKLGVLSDQHDDVVATFTGDAIVDSTAYNPFGEVIASTGAKRRLGYQGEYTDPTTGKVNMASRWYIPGTGGFASRDDYTIDPYPSINLNRYTYARGNPLAYTDPSGNCPFCIPLLIIVVRVVAQVAVKAVAKQVVKQVVKKTVKQVVKKTVKQVKKTVKQVKKPAKQVKKPATPRVKKPATPRVKKPATPRVKNPGRPSAKKPGRPSAKKPSKGGKPGTKPAGKPTTRKPPSKPKKTSQRKKNTNQKLDGIGLAAEEFAGLGTGSRDLGGNRTDAPDLGGVKDFLCYSLTSCAKDVVEEITEEIADQAIGEIIEQVVPDLPIDTPGMTASCALPSSFVSGTLVLMADGSRKPIEQIEPGEEVLAADPTTGRTEARAVTTLITSEGTKNLVDITVTVDGKSDILTATDAHPFWLPKRQTWANAGNLQPGMWLKTSAGTYVQIAAITRWTASQRVYNLTVDELHTYYVVAGDQAVLVHNDGWNPFKKKSGSVQPSRPDPNATIQDLLRYGRPDVNGSKGSRDKLEKASKMQDWQMRDSIFEPLDGEVGYIRVGPDGENLENGNHRAEILLEWAADPDDEEWKYDTKIYIANHKGC